jgi:hypothetical protein
LVAPVITTQPVGQTVNVGAAVALTVVATGTEPLTYTWLKNDLELGGPATNATLNLAAVGSGDSGQYRVRINNAGGFALSDVAQVTVNAAITPPSIVSEPSTITKYVGESVRLGVQVSPGSDGLAPVVTWLKNGVEMPGVLGNGFNLSPLVATDAGQYVAKASGAGGSVFSAPTTVVPVPLPVMAATAGSSGLKLVFPVLPGREYRLEGQSALGGAWTERQVLRPDTSTTEAVLPLDSNSGFFRVRVTLLP